MLIVNRHPRLDQLVNHSPWCVPAMGTSSWPANAKQSVLEWDFTVLRDIYEHPHRTTIAQPKPVHESEGTDGRNASFGVLCLGGFFRLDILRHCKSEALELLFHLTDFFV